MSELFGALLRANFTASLVVLGVLAVRIPIRRRLGADAAYGLWLAPVAAFLGSLVPASEAESDAAAAAARAALPGWLSGASGPPDPRLAAAWIAGGLAAGAMLWIAQGRYMAKARRGEAGPALVGVLCPRIVTPRNYETLFSPGERSLIRAHERAHMDRGDARVNALLSALQCLCWFNPIVHLAAHLARQDQEIACDAAVMRRRPAERRLYAETMLKTQVSRQGLPLGCHWAARGAHPLEARIRHLKQAPPDEARRTTGAGLVALLALLGAGGAWAAKPPAPPHAMFIPSCMLPDNQGPHTSVILITIPAGAKLDAAHLRSA